jgi:hypothetical protein
MKRCPTCNRSFEDDTLSFCLEDGTPLVTEVGGRSDSQQTLVSPRPPETSGGSAPTQPYVQRPGASTSPYPAASPTYGPGGGGHQTWPWVVGVFAILSVAVVAILIVVFTVPGILKPTENGNRQQPSPSRPEPSATPTWSPSPESDVPTDSAEVLEQLTQLEKDWTEANIKGDKEALEKILADEYVGNEDESRTKRKYIDTLKPDPSVEEWEIYDVTVDQTGERAVVKGRLKQETTDGTEVYEFVDTWVWRDHRWQAVTSVTTSVK